MSELDEDIRHYAYEAGEAYERGNISEFENYRELISKALGRMASNLYDHRNECSKCHGGENVSPVTRKCLYCLEDEERADRWE